MAKSQTQAGIYAALLVGAVSGAAAGVVSSMLHIIRKERREREAAAKAKAAGTKLTGDVALPYKDPVTSKYDEGWNDGLSGQYTFDGASGDYYNGYHAAQTWKQSQGLSLP